MVTSLAAVWPLRSCPVGSTGKLGTLQNRRFLESPPLFAHGQRVDTMDGPCRTRSINQKRDLQSMKRCCPTKAHYHNVWAHYKKGGLRPLACHSGRMLQGLCATRITPDACSSSAER